MNKRVNEILEGIKYLAIELVREGGDDYHLIMEEPDARAGKQKVLIDS